MNHVSKFSNFLNEAAIPEDLDAAIKSYVADLNKHVDEEHDEHYSTLKAAGGVPVFSYKVMKKYVKVISETYNKYRSVFCFVDVENGNILKPAGWSAPADGKRGSVYDEKRPLNAGQLYRTR